MEEIMDRFEYGFRFPGKTEQDYQAYLRQHGQGEPLTGVEQELDIQTRITQLDKDQRYDAMHMALVHGKKAIGETELDFVESPEYAQLAKERAERWQHEKEQAKQA